MKTDQRATKNYESISYKRHPSRYKPLNILSNQASAFRREENIFSNLPNGYKAVLCNSLPRSDLFSIFKGNTFSREQPRTYILWEKAILDFDEEKFVINPLPKFSARSELANWRKSSHY
jgi:hypothetical protein